MGNIMSGHELISRKTRKPVYGLTLPLVTTEMGDKFGKSAGNAVWLSNEKSTPFTLYQFFVRTTDADVEKFLKLFTFETTGFISDLMRRHEEAPEAHLAQKHLAEKVTILVHGEEGLKQAKLSTSILYDADIKSLGEAEPKDLISIFSNATTVELLPEAGMTVLELAMKAKCFPTESTLRKH